MKLTILINYHSFSGKKLKYVLHGIQNDCHWLWSER